MPWERSSERFAKTRIGSLMMWSRVESGSSPIRQKDEFFDLVLRIGTSSRISDRRILGQRAIESFCWRFRVAATQFVHSMSSGGVTRTRESGYSTLSEPTLR